MELNEDCHDSVDVLDTATTTIVHDTLDDDSFDTQSISSNASGKKPLYKRAWRKVYKTITAPEKDASGQRISLRDSISMRLSRDGSVSSSSSSFFAGGGWTPRSARHPTSRSEFALSETHTAPLPHSSDDTSPLRSSRSHAPYSVDNATPLPLPTDQVQQQKIASAHNQHPPPEAPAPATVPARRPPVPPLRNTDMSLSQLAGRTGETPTVTPITSARAYGSSLDSPATPATDPDNPPSAPQFSAASLVQGEDSRSSVHQESARRDSVQAAMPKRQPDWPAGSNDEPTSKRPHLPSGPPEEASEGTVEQLAITSSGAKGVEAKQHSRWRRHGVTSPPNSNGPSVSKLKQLHPSSRGSGAVKQAEVTPAEFQRKMLEGELQRLQFVADAPRESSRQLQEKPGQPAQLPFGTEHPNLPSPLQTSSRAANDPSVDSPVAIADNIPVHGLLGAIEDVPPTMQASTAAVPKESKTAARAVVTDEIPAAQVPQAAPSTSAAESQPVLSSQVPAASTVPPSSSQLLEQPGVPTDPRLQKAAEQVPPDRYTSTSTLSRPAAQPLSNDSAVPAGSTAIPQMPTPSVATAGTADTPSSLSLTNSSTRLSAGSENSMPNVQPGQTQMSQISNIPITPGSSLAVVSSSASDQATPVLYSDSPRDPDSGLARQGTLDTENVIADGSEGSSGGFFVANDALKKQSSKTSKHMSAVSRPAAVKSPLSEHSVSQQQLLQPHGSVNSSCVIEHGSGVSAAAAAAASELQNVSVELPDGTSAQMPSSAQPGLPTTHASTADMRRDLPLSAGVGAMLGDLNLKDAATDNQSTSVNAVDVCGMGVQGENVSVEVDMEADSAAGANQARDLTAADLDLVAGSDSDGLEKHVRELVLALEGRLTTTGTLEGAISGHGEGDSDATGNNLPVSGAGDSIVQGMGRSESIGSTSGMGAVAGSSSVSAQDVIEKFESSQPRSRHIFSPSPSPGKSGRGRDDSASAHHGATADDTKAVPSKGGKKRGGVVRTLVKAAAVVAVGAGAAFAVARGR